MLHTLIALEFDFLRTPPVATYAIMLLSLGLGLITSLVNIKMMDLKAYRLMMIDSAKARYQMMAAMKSGNQRRIDKAQKKQNDIMSQQSKMSMDRLKISLFFMIPFLLIWQVLGSFYGNSIVAYFPFDAPFIPRELSVATWYLICSFAFNILISRILGLTFEIDPEESVVKEDEQL